MLAGFPKGVGRESWQQGTDDAVYVIDETKSESVLRLQYATLANSMKISRP